MTADPWVPPAEDAATLLDDVRQFVARFVAFPSEAALVAVVLWIVHTHLVQDGENSPRLALLSPEPGSGKTRTLEVLELLTPNPVMTVNASPAPIFRSIGAGAITLLFDEVDALFGRSVKIDDPAADMRALLNAGHRRGATIMRCVGPTQLPTKFPVYAAVALAGLGDLPDTLMSRSVIVRMRRRAPGEHVEPFRRRLHADAGEMLALRIAEWAETVGEAVGNAWPVMPTGITDRPADVWEPLLAIADAAGGEWPDTARGACVELCKVAETRQASLGVRLLGDLREVFGDETALPTATVLSKLHELGEAPWAELRGQPLDARGLARMLRQYDVRSTKIKVGEQSLHGYRREHLWDSWLRYLPPSVSDGPERAEHPEPRTSDDMSAVPDTATVPEPGSDPEPFPPALTCVVPPVPQVPHIQQEAARQLCTGCGDSLDPTLAALGETTHPSCGADAAPHDYGRESNR